MGEEQAIVEGFEYGLWSLVVINSFLFILFAFSFTRPRTVRDWRAFGAFSAFLIALFTEMYGFPLSIFFLSGWLQSQYPNIDWLRHDAGHLPEMLFGWQSNPHLGPFHTVSNILIFSGFALLALSWRVLYKAQVHSTLATTGPYARLRHPQYLGFALIMLGFLFQWPTIATIIMFPILVLMYWRLSQREEQEVEARFGDTYRQYASQVPRYIPKIGTRFGRVWARNSARNTSNSS